MLERLKRTGQALNRLDNPVAQGLLALANGIACVACFKASKKPLYRVAGGLLATFTGYHIYKAIKKYKGR